MSNKALFGMTMIQSLISCRFLERFGAEKMPLRATENCQLRNYFFFSHFCNYRWKCIFCRNSVHLFPAEYRYRTILFSKQKKYINFTLSKGVLSGSYLRMQIRFSSLPFTSLFVLHPIKHSVSQLLIGSLRA